MSEKGEPPNKAAEAPNSSEPQKVRTRAGKVQTLQEKLEKLEREAEAVRQKLQAQRRKERESNARQITVLVQKEDLADFSMDAWRSALPKIRAALESAEAAAG